MLSPYQCNSLSPIHSLAHLTITTAFYVNYSTTLPPFLVMYPDSVLGLHSSL